MQEFMHFCEMLLRPVLAIIGAGVLGWEREVHKKPAGLRTQMMVALGASVFTLATLEFYRDIAAANGAIRVDPLRVIEGVVGGIGFLGAGCIIQSRGSVEGITTAATIWVVGAVGVCCGLGYYPLAGATVLLALIVLSAVGSFEKHTLEPRFINGNTDEREGKLPDEDPS